MAVPHNFNPKSTTVRRIRADLREMNTDPSPNYHAAPLEDSLFDWHFTIRGPPDTEFAGGIYHGRIILPTDYPFKPPNIMLLTPNGRFEVRKKICLSISAYHPETWLPAWGIRLILEALISFMPSKGEGAVGALDYTPEERRRLAAQSRSWVCPSCGPITGLLPEPPKDAGVPRTPSKYAAEIAKMHMHAVPQPAAGKATDGDDGDGGAAGAAAEAAEPTPAAGAGGSGNVVAPEVAAVTASATAPAAATVPAAEAPVGAAEPVPAGTPAAPVTLEHPGLPKGDRCLGVLVWLFTFAIVAVLLRKVNREYGLLW